MNQYLLLLILDFFFIIFHTLLIAFNLFGWMFKKTRFLNFLTLQATAFSWFILGIWYGWGYCFCTDWHWEIRYALGKPMLESSYTAFLFRSITGIQVPSFIMDMITLIGFLIAYGISTYLQVRKWILKAKMLKQQTKG
ncbi:MAG: DUF2784 domain-containing protein [Bacteroidales bacterium]|nr:DUF2784 domain-containing protein [Bacteroidales bacterium]